MPLGPNCFASDFHVVHCRRFGLGVIIQVGGWIVCLLGRELPMMHEPAAKWGKAALMM